jgi:hypothetical protein
MIRIQRELAECFLQKIPRGGDHGNLCPFNINLAKAGRFPF